MTMMSTQYQVVYALNSRLSQSLIKEYEKAWLSQAFFLLCLIFLTACTSVHISSRYDALESELTAQGLQAEVLTTNQFKLYLARPDIFNPIEEMNLIIEGDGLAWRNRYTLSDNPTPLEPTGLFIARQMKLRKPLPYFYLARPCQYLNDQKCTPHYWSVLRYSPEVLESYMQALDQLKLRYGVKNFSILGFSGGAYIAFVLSSLRDDISNVTSVAGLMDPESWNDFHDSSAFYLPFENDVLLKKTKHVSFTHICSDADNILPCSLAQKFTADAKVLGLTNHDIVILNGGFEHENIWAGL